QQPGQRAALRLDRDALRLELRERRELRRRLDLGLDHLRFAAERAQLFLRRMELRGQQLDLPTEEVDRAARLGVLDVLPPRDEPRGEDVRHLAHDAAVRVPVVDERDLRLAARTLDLDGLLQVLDHVREARDPHHELRLPAGRRGEREAGAWELDALAGTRVAEHALRARVPDDERAVVALLEHVLALRRATGDLDPFEQPRALDAPRPCDAD